MHGWSRGCAASTLTTALSDYSHFLACEMPVVASGFRQLASGQGLRAGLSRLDRDDSSPEACWGLAGSTFATGSSALLVADSDGSSCAAGSSRADGYLKPWSARSAWCQGQCQARNLAAWSCCVYATVAGKPRASIASDWQLWRGVKLALLPMQFICARIAGW